MFEIAGGIVLAWIVLANFRAFLAVAAFLILLAIVGLFIAW